MQENKTFAKATHGAVLYLSFHIFSPPKLSIRELYVSIRRFTKSVATWQISKWHIIKNFLLRKVLLTFFALNNWTTLELCSLDKSKNFSILFPAFFLIYRRNYQIIMIFSYELFFHHSTRHRARIFSRPAPTKARRKLTENTFEASCVWMENNEFDLKKKHCEAFPRSSSTIGFCLHRGELVFT